MQFDKVKFVSGFLFIVGSIAMVASLLAACVLQNFAPFTLCIPGAVAVSAGLAMD